VFAEALQVMLWDNRQHDMQRAAGFLKRLSTLALHLAPAEAMAGMRFGVILLSEVSDFYLDNG